MKATNIKIYSIFIIVFTVCSILIFQTETAVHVGAAVDTAADYKAKCAMCHGQAAEKAFDPAKPIESHIEVIMKGKKDSRPPMPGYEAKGMTQEQAKALAELMVAFRQTPK